MSIVFTAPISCTFSDSSGVVASSLGMIPA